MRIQINLPNDYNSEERQAEMIRQIYDGDEGACERDLGQSALDSLAAVARAGGLKYISDSDFGAIWEGSARAIREVKSKLPAWAGF